MSIELLYTSAPQGLKQGSRGFCTVISTGGMPLNLATRLESLSAYRHTYPPNSPDAAKNPICFSHIKMTVGGQRLSVLSRIADYGVDYSQRTNKIAHHVVVKPDEYVPAGPAWLLQHGGIMRSHWNGECETPASGPTLPATEVQSGHCELWKSITGDAAWGGKVAEGLTQAGGKPTWIIFDVLQSKHVLGLIHESVALLAPAERWQATFSTFATNLPPDVDCRLRCVLAGTDEARLAPARGTVIDLTKPLGAPPTSRFAQAEANFVEGQALGFVLREDSSTNSQVAPSARSARDDISYSEPDTTIHTHGAALNISPSPPPTTKPPAIVSRLIRTETAEHTKTYSRKSNRRVIAVTCTAFALIFSLVAAVLLSPKATEIASSKEVPNASSVGKLESKSSSKNDTAVYGTEKTTGRNQVGPNFDTEETPPSQKPKLESSISSAPPQAEVPRTNVETKDQSTPIERKSVEGDSEPVKDQVSLTDGLSVDSNTQVTPSEITENDIVRAGSSPNYKITARLDQKKLESLGKYIVAVELEMSLDKSWMIKFFEQGSNRPCGAPRKLGELGNVSDVPPIVSMSAKFDSEPQKLLIWFESTNDQPLASRLFRNNKDLLKECAFWEKKDPFMFLVKVKEESKEETKEESKNVAKEEWVALTPISSKEGDFIARCMRLGQHIDANSHVLTKIKQSAEDIKFKESLQEPFRKLLEVNFPDRQNLFDKIEQLYQQVSDGIAAISSTREFDFTGVIKISRNNVDEILPLKFECRVDP